MELAIKFIEEIYRCLEEENINYNEKYIASRFEKINKYMNLVLKYNESINLTAIKDRKEFEIKNVIDSLCCIKSKEYQNGRRIIDVGTGAGLPGIPLAVMSPDKEFLLMDSLAKRVKVVNEIVRELGLNNVKAVHGRAEDMAREKKYRESFDICVSRAVSRLPVLCEYCLPFVKEGGTFISYKGSSFSEEIKEASNALGILGGKVLNIDEDSMKEFGLFHALIYVSKIKRTPDIYPRKAGVPLKKPL